MKFVLTDDDKRIFSWIRADSSNDPGGPHLDLPGGKVDPEETLLQAAHRELEEELSPYGLDLRNQVEAALSAAPNGHSQARMKLSDRCYGHYQIMVWGISISGTEPLVPLETQNNLEAQWRDPEEVWPSFRGPRAPYGVAARLAWEAADSRQSDSTTSNSAEAEDPIPTPPLVMPTPVSTAAWTNELWDPQPGTFYGTGDSSYRTRGRHAPTSPCSSTFQMREEVTTQLWLAKSGSLPMKTPYAITVPTLRPTNHNSTRTVEKWNRRQRVTRRMRPLQTKGRRYAARVMAT